MANMSGYEVICNSPTEDDSRRARSSSSGSGGSSGADSKHNEDHDDASFPSIEELLVDGPVNESGRSKGIYYTVGFHILCVRRNF
jgi:hypothetical protein